MGKNLHHTIRPFIESALNSHSNVERFEKIETETYYAYRVFRRRNMSPVIIVLNDEYNYSESEVYNKPSILDDGGFILIARPEAGDYDESYPQDRLSVGKIRKLLGALSKARFWEYQTPIKD